MKLAGIVYESIADGPGLRIVIFTQGCPHHCEGCHNKDTWDNEGGKEYHINDILWMIQSYPNRKFLRGITLSGGEPFLQARELIPLVSEIRHMGLDVIAYTGYKYDELINSDEDKQTLLKLVDYLVDGPYIKSERYIDGGYKGSANQRIIDVQWSLKENTIAIIG